VKPAPFAYVRPAAPDQAFALLVWRGDDGRPSAGGQGLSPTPRLRRSERRFPPDLDIIARARAVAVTTPCPASPHVRGSTALAGERMRTGQVEAPAA
jgi:hypothetical protein